jgi:hypothetical protein
MRVLWRHDNVSTGVLVVRFLFVHKEFVAPKKSEKKQELRSMSERQNPYRSLFSCSRVDISFILQVSLEINPNHFAPKRESYILI